MRADDNTFRLKITAYTPRTIPMVRLVEYLRELASLLGSAGQVHYLGATIGSTVMKADVEPEAVAAVRARVRVAANDPTSDAHRAIERIDSLLRADSARGSLSHQGEKWVKFLGVDACIAERIGPIHESTTVDGEVLRVGGKDRTLHALLAASDGQEMKLTTRDRDMARRLAVHLFERVRVTGTGVWYRDEAAVWTMNELRVESFEPIADRSLLEAVSELRAVAGSGWRDMADPLAVARQLRKH